MPAVARDIEIEQGATFTKVLSVAAGYNTGWTGRATLRSSYVQTGYSGWQRDQMAPSLYLGALTVDLSAASQVTIGMAANLGMVLVGCVAIVYPASADSWRTHFLIGASPAIITLLIRFFVPESEKWQRTQAAPESPQRTSTVREVFAGELLRPTLGGILMVSVVFVGTWGAVQWIPLWITELAGPKAPQAKAYAMVIVSTGACVGTVLAPLLLARLRRRLGYQILCVLAVASTAWIYRTPASWDGWMPFGVFPAYLGLKVFVLGMTATAFFGFMPLYLPELFPTRVRATGQGICYNTGRLVAVPFVLLSGKLVETLGGYQHAAAAITLVYLAGLGIAYLGRETSGQALQD